MTSGAPSAASLSASPRRRPPSCPQQSGGGPWPRRFWGPGRQQPAHWRRADSCCCRWVSRAPEVPMPAASGALQSWLPSLECRHLPALDTCLTRVYYYQLVQEPSWVASALAVPEAIAAAWQSEVQAGVPGTATDHSQSGGASETPSAQQHVATAAEPLGAELSAAAAAATRGTAQPETRHVCVGTGGAAVGEAARRTAGPAPSPGVGQTTLPGAKTRTGRAAAGPGWAPGAGQGAAAQAATRDPCAGRGSAADACSSEDCEPRCGHEAEEADACDAGRRPCTCCPRSSLQLDQPWCYHYSRDGPRTRGGGSRCSEAVKLRRAYQSILQQLQARHSRELCMLDARSRQQVRRLSCGWS